MHERVSKFLFRQQCAVQKRPIPHKSWGEMQLHRERPGKRVHAHKWRQHWWRWIGIGHKC